MFGQLPGARCAVSRGLPSGRAGSCLDSCLNLNPDRLAPAPSPPFPPALPPFLVLWCTATPGSVTSPAEPGSALPSRTGPGSRETRPGQGQEKGQVARPRRIGARLHPGVPQQPLPLHLKDMEEKPADTNAGVDNSASPSVAQLAGLFREQASAKEPPANKPTRRKPPCSLSLFPPKIEMGQNGEEKSSPNACQPPKGKMKSSPLIEKLQANLAFAPAALMPGASPKSPGLKAIVSPFHSPPSTPNSPGFRSRSTEPEEVPVSFDQPPEGSHLPSYNKVRTRGSIKRRPPSRRFRRSQSDCGVDLGDLGATQSSQENGAKEEDSDEVFTSKNKALESPLSSNSPMGKELRRKLESDEKPLLRRASSMTENQGERSRALEEIMSCKNALKNKEQKQQNKEKEDEGEPHQRDTESKEETSENPKAQEKETSPGDSGKDRKEKTTEGPTSEMEGTSEKTTGGEEEKPGEKNPGAKDGEPKQSTATGTNEERPQNIPKEKEGDKTNESEKDKEDNDLKEGISENTDNQEITCNQESNDGTEHSQPVTDSEITNETPRIQSSCSAKDDTIVEDTKM